MAYPAIWVDRGLVEKSRAVIYISFDYYSLVVKAISDISLSRWQVELSFQRINNNTASTLSMGQSYYGQEARLTVPLSPRSDRQGLPCDFPDRAHDSTAFGGQIIWRKYHFSKRTTSSCSGKRNIATIRT